MRYTAAGLAVVLICSLACTGGSAEEVDPSVEAPVDPGAVPEPEPEPEPEPDPAEFLQALVATSNAADAALLLDGDPETRWVPEPDAAGEGVLVRFEKPHPISAVSVVGCDGVQNHLQLFIDARLIGTVEGEQVPFEIPDDVVARSLFVKVVSGEAACLADLVVSDGTEPLRLAPPRRVDARVEVSSTLEPVSAYHSSYLFDGRPNFAWVEGSKGAGEGESIQLTFARDQPIVGIEIWNGYQRSDDHFQKNARARKLEVEAEGRRVMLDVGSASGPQKLYIDPPLTARVLTLTVAASTKGSAYEDMVISELRFVDRQGPFSVTPMQPPELDEQLRKSLAGKPMGDVVGKQFRQACGAEREMKFRWDHSFVRYERIGEGEEESTEEVFDGAWVPSKDGAKLYGRRHTIEETWAPYGDTSVVESDKVSGGDITVKRFQDLGKDGVMEAIGRFQKAGAGDRVECLMDGRQPDPEKVKALHERGEVIVIEGKAIMDILVHAP